ncbi:MAG: cysteine synthase [Myxococcales bacterium]|nr:cysteine synthase [Myxococcales bacterium]
MRRPQQPNPTEVFSSTRVRSAVELIGNTPLVRLRSITRDLPPKVEVYAKLEYFNPGGSVKDRAAWQMVRDAIADGRLTDDKTLIDSTSGNTGVAYAMIGAALGLSVSLVMPENVSQARKDIARAYGTHIIFSDPMESSDGAIRLVRQLVAEDKASGANRYFYPNQYANPGNPKAHYLTTAPEIWEQTGGRVTHFVTGLGTSGTIMGTGRRLKAYNPDIQVIGAQPTDSFHGLEGWKHMESSIQPQIFHPGELDDMLYIDTDDGWDMTERLAREEGIFVGHSGGGSLVAALEVASQLEEGVVVTLFPDHADRYTN